jgi:hypothetical protein
MPVKRSVVPSRQLEVVTGVRQVSAAGSADADVHAISNGYHAEPFFFVVPWPCLKPAPRASA